MRSCVCVCVCVKKKFTHLIAYKLQRGVYEGERERGREGALFRKRVEREERGKEKVRDGENEMER